LIWDFLLHKETFMTNHERRFDPKKKDMLVGSKRWNRWNPPRLLALAGVKPGATVVDLGCGPGFWTIPIAEIVGPTGQVIALDVSSDLLAELGKHHPPPQVRLVLGELPTIDLPDKSVDLVWAAFVFHEVEPPSTFAAEMRRVLRPGGTIIILDWRPDAKSVDGPPTKQRFSTEQVSHYLRSAGFELIEIAWQDDDAYLIKAR
jgi:ubiquinone/menaquinone biosynthesis C-methylase UbiE